MATELAPSRSLLRSFFSFFAHSLHNAGIIIWLFSTLFFASSSANGQTTRPSSEIENLIDHSAKCRLMFADGQFNNNTEIPPSPIMGSDAGELCLKGMTCCTKSMEAQLQLLSIKEYQNLMHKALEPIQTTFTSRTNKFDEFFRKLLKKSYNELHVMFVTTYGLLYQQNSRVFSELFNNLTNYYKGRDVDLEKALRTFFINLLKKMFQLLNLQYKLDEPYLECVGSKMDKFKPFEDIPKKLASQVKRAFIAARTFVQGLTIGRDFINTISKLSPSKECMKSVTRMIHCPSCQGKVHKKPCSEYCFGTIRSCQPYDKELNEAWNQYIDALKMVARRLDGPFNIESVVDPINVKISDAIMTYQNKAEFVSAKVFSECGHPSIRQKRDANDMNYQKYDYEWPSAKKNHVRPTTAAGTSLDRLVKDINEKVKKATDYWVNIPQFICQDETLSAEGGAFKDENMEDQFYNNTDFTVNPVSDCWHPESLESVENAMQKDDMLNVNDPERERTHTIVFEQVSQLKIMTTKLQNAYNGLYVESIPDLDGSGDSSGANEDEDDEEDYSSGSGSGAGTNEYVAKHGEAGSSDPKSTGNYYFVTESTPLPTRQSPNDNRGQSSATRLLQQSVIVGFMVLATFLFG